METALTPKEQKQLAWQSIIIELSHFFNIPQNELENTIKPIAQCIRSTYTNHKLTAYFFHWQLTTGQEQRIKKHVQENNIYFWTANSENYAMPSHHRKAHGKHHKEDKIQGVISY